MRLINPFRRRQQTTAAEPVRPALIDYTPEPVEARPVQRAPAIIIPRRGSVRMYEAARVNRTTSDWPAMSTSADTELVTSLRLLRARSQWMVRENPYALNGVRVIVNNVIGSGIGMTPQVRSAGGTLQTRINDDIKAAWKDWASAENCHTAGLLAFEDIERLAMGLIVQDGEVLLRKVRQPFGDSNIPLALEVIESARLMDQWQTARAPNGNLIKMGVEMDDWGRPTAYWFWPIHPGDYNFQTFVPSKFIRVEAADIIHLYAITRWPQTRGVPWYHAALLRLRHAGEYENSELIAARASANIVGFVETPDNTVPGEARGTDEQGNTIDTQRILDTEPGLFQTLFAGEKFVGFNPSRPNSALEPFLRYMVRSSAISLGISYSPISGDYSQHNFSSLRMESLSDRDHYRTIQTWLIRRLRQGLHKEFLDAAVLAGAIKTPDYYTNSRKYWAVKWQPRGWTWIDPREVNYMKTAVRSGFTTVTDVISQTAGGADAEDVFSTREQELELMQKLGLVFDTDPAFVDDNGQEQPDKIEPDNDADDKAVNKPQTAAA